MTQKRRSAFPFDMIVIRVRVNDTLGEKCIFDQNESTHVLDHFVNDLLALKQKGGIIDIDAIWRDAILRQIKGDYKPIYYQPVCEECCVHFSTIQLGKKRPILHLLPLLSIAKKQRGLDFSLALMCTVKSFDDEGDTWAMNAPGIDVEDVVEYIRSHK